MSFKITLSDAEGLMNAYINDIIKDQAVIAPDIIGGTIKTDPINKMRAFWKTFQISANDLAPIETLEVFKGLATWCCWEEANPRPDSDFFLAFEINNSIMMDVNDIQFPQHEILARPMEILRYNDPQTAIDILKTVSRNFNLPETIERGFDSTESGKVLKMLTDFKQHGLKDPQNKPFNEVPFGLFENRTPPKEVDEFINQQDLRYVRYYFGYNPQKTINRIRVILVGVDQHGKNLLPTTPDRLKDDEPILLQTSWPPKT